MSFEDHWVEVNKVPTRVLTWGADLNDLSGVKELVLCIPGNPGLTGYYVTFLESLHARSGVPAWMITHAGHELPPANHSPRLTLPRLSDKTNQCLFDLQGQVQHKLAFMLQYIPSHVKVTLVGHSMGARVIVDLLREAPQIVPSVGGAYLLFPTLERIRDTPAAGFLVPLLTYFTSVILFLATIFQLLPRPLQRFLVGATFYLQHCRAADNHCVQGTVGLIHPTVLRHVFFLALDEMERIKELDVKTLDQHAAKLRLYFGASDDWCPTAFYYNLKDKCPTVRSYLCRENIKHAFVLYDAETMAEKVAAWMEEDRVPSDSEIMSPT